MIRLGVLTYDLQPFTADLLQRLQAALPDVRLTAYPCFAHPAQTQAGVRVLPSTVRATPFGVSRGGVREAFTASVNPRAAWRLAADNDIVMLYGLQGLTALLVALLCSIRRRRLISVNHALSPELERQRRWWVRGLKRLLFAACDWHVCQMPAAVANLTEVYGIDPARISFAPFEGGARLYAPLAATRDARRVRKRADLGLGDAVLMLFVGNIIPLKGPDLFVRAVAALPGVRGVLAGPEEPGYGDAGTVAYYAAMATELGAAGRVTLTGRIDAEALADLYAAADVFVLPTWKDCMPKVFIEAGLFGLPIVTTVAPGSVGVLPQAGVNGEAVPIGDVAALTDAMRRLLDADLRTRYAAAARATVNAFCDGAKEIAGFVTAVHAMERATK